MKHIILFLFAAQFRLMSAEPISVAEINLGISPKGVSIRAMLRFYQWDDEVFSMDTVGNVIVTFLGDAPEPIASYYLGLSSYNLLHIETFRLPDRDSLHLFISATHRPTHTMIFSIETGAVQVIYENEGSLIECELQLRNSSKAALCEFWRKGDFQETQNLGRGVLIPGGQFVRRTLYWNGTKFEGDDKSETTVVVEDPNAVKIHTD